jgi:hypothetical protein
MIAGYFHVIRLWFKARLRHVQKKGRLRDGHIVGLWGVKWVMWLFIIIANSAQNLRLRDLSHESCLRAIARQKVTVSHAEIWLAMCR